jgi:hypothetical protein
MNKSGAERERERERERPHEKWRKQKDPSNDL